MLYYPNGAHFYTNVRSIITQIAESTLLPFVVTMFGEPPSGFSVFYSDGMVTLSLSVGGNHARTRIGYLREDEIWQGLGDKFLELIVGIAVERLGYSGAYGALATNSYCMKHAEEHGFMECVAEWLKAYNLGKGANAYRRAENLLKSQLQQWQLDDYNNNGRITVYGGQTNYPYVIHKGGSYNVTCYQPDGTYVLCVTTAERGIPAPDKMLSQMYMIELDEMNFRAIANWARAK